VVAVVPHVKLVMLTPSTVIEVHCTEPVMVYADGKVTVRVSVALTYITQNDTGMVSQLVIPKLLLCARLKVKV